MPGVLLLVCAIDRLQGLHHQIPPNTHKIYLKLSIAALRKADAKAAQLKDALEMLLRGMAEAQSPSRSPGQPAAAQQTPRAGPDTFSGGATPRKRTAESPRL